MTATAPGWRRRMTLLLALWPALGLWPLAVGAQEPPPLRLIVPVTAGGSLDSLARKFALAYTAVTGKPVMVDNRPGASSQIGVDLAARAAPDGRTWLLAGSFLSTNPLQFRHALNPMKDLRPVIKLADNEIFLAVHAGLPVRNLADLRQLAQERRQGLNCAAIPGQMALGCERLRTLLGAPVVPIPFPGAAPAVQAVAAGHVDLVFGTHGALRAQAESQRIRLLAATGTRAGSPPFEQLPLARDTWPGFVLQGYAGLFVPAGTPDAVVQSLNDEFNRALAHPELIAGMRELGYTRVGGRPESLLRTLVQDAAFYGRIAADAGIVPQ